MTAAVDPSTIGGRIRARRRSLGLSQGALALAVIESGEDMTQPQVSHLERGRFFRSPPLPAIAEALGTSVAWLRTGEQFGSRA